MCVYVYIFEVIYMLHITCMFRCSFSMEKIHI